MKKILKRSLIAILITLSLIATVGIAVVATSTETDVASATIGSETVYYDSLAEAITAAYTNAPKDADGYYTVTVHKNTTVSSGRIHVPGKLRLIAETGKTLTVTAPASHTNGLFCVCTSTCTVAKAGDVTEGLIVENLSFVLNGTNAASSLVTLNDTTGATHNLTFKNVNVKGNKNLFYNAAETTKGTYNITIDGGTWQTTTATNNCLIYDKYNKNGDTTIAANVDFNLKVSNMTLKAGIYQGHRGNLGTADNRSTFTNVTIDSPWYLLVPVGNGYTHTYLKFENCTVGVGTKGVTGSGAANTKNNIIDIVAKNTTISNDGTMPLFVNTAHPIKLDFEKVKLITSNDLFKNNSSRADNRFDIKFVDVESSAINFWDGSYINNIDVTSLYFDKFKKIDSNANAFNLNPSSKNGCVIKLLNCSAADVAVGELGGKYTVYMDNASASTIKLKGVLHSESCKFDTDKGQVDGFVYGFSIAKLVQEYKDKNPNAAEHKITNLHNIVYDADAYFKDNVNGTTSLFSCYAKLGADALMLKLKNASVLADILADTNAASGKEILVGLVDRSAQNEFLSKVDANEYGIFVTENNIILLAWNDAALRVCVEGFTNYISSTTLSLPVGFEFVGIADSDWKTDFIRPENTTLSASQYLNDDSLQFLYTGTDATNAGYVAYCEKLVADGFELVWSSAIGNNEFRMYKNTAKDTVLYVAYNDYTYSAEFEAKYKANYTEATNAYLPVSFTKCIRIVSSPLSTTVLPDDVNKKQDYTKVTDSYFTTLGIAEGNVGTGHVVMLEDGRFIVVDGGNCTYPVTEGNNTTYKACDANKWCEHMDLIWNTMLNLYKKAHNGAAPTADKPIHVAAWYLTHAHSDHYNSFYKMITLIDGNTSKKSVFKMDYIIANLPGENSLFNTTSTTWGYSASFASMQTLLGGIKVIKPYAGQKLYFANVTIETLMTFGDHLPFIINNTNDTNTVTRFHIESGDNSTSVMFLGDSWRPSSRFLCAMYGKYLKSDISQVSHHGNIGAEKELYEAIAPNGLLFNNTFKTFQKYVWGRYNGKNLESTHAYAVSRYVVRELASVKYVWTAVEGTLPTIQFTTEGAQYDSAFDLANGNALTYKDSIAPATEQTGFIKKESVKLHEHNYKWVSFNDTYHQYECECGAVSKITEHSPEADDNDCTTATKCAVCGHILVEANDFHTPDADGKCMDCGTTITPETTKPVENTTPTTDKPKDSGCNSNVTACGLALVATLGTCAVFIEKKRK